MVGRTQKGREQRERRKKRINSRRRIENEEINVKRRWKEKEGWKKIKEGKQLLKKISLEKVSPRERIMGIIVIMTKRK